MLKSIRLVVPILISVGGLFSMLLVAGLLHNDVIPVLEISQYELVNFTFMMQVSGVALSVVAIALMYLYDVENFTKYFRIGTRGSGENDWRITGSGIAVVFTLGTTFYMSTSVASQHGLMNESFFGLIPLVLLFSATNAWSEEIFSRFVIVAGLDGKLSPTIICWISAAVFGLAHISGTPNGLFGVIMSGLLGFFLARSVVETRGLGWALFIHFLQDVVIFGAGAMVLAGQG